MEVDALACELVASDCVEGSSNVLPSYHHPTQECVVKVDDYMSDCHPAVEIELRWTAESPREAIRWKLAGDDEEGEDDKCGQTI